MSNDPIALIRRWFEEVWNQRREEVIDEMLSDESVCHADDGPIRGPQEFKERQYAPFIAAFPDLRLEVEATLGEGDQVVARWVAIGRHTGDGLGFQATHETATLRGITWVRIREGKMIEGWQHSNIPEVIRQLAAKALP